MPLPRSGVGIGIKPGGEAGRNSHTLIEEAGTADTAPAHPPHLPVAPMGGRPGSSRGPGWRTWVLLALLALVRSARYAVGCPTGQARLVFQLITVSALFLFVFPTVMISRNVLLLPYPFAHPPPPPPRPPPSMRAAIEIPPGLFVSTNNKNICKLSLYLQKKETVRLHPSRPGTVPACPRPWISTTPSDMAARYDGSVG